MQEFRKRFSGPLAPMPGMPEWERELLCARGIDTPEKAEKFLHPCLEDLLPPERMPGMDRALDLIRGAIRRGDRILVWGDYDVDGVSAVTVMLETLREAGARADYYIPKRHSEGYGLNLEGVERAAEENNLLITVDCGISNVREVSRAKELGMSVLVTDHHELPDTLPPADAILNPKLGDYPFRHLCGAGVALKVCQAMQGAEGLEKRLEIAALATVADIVPLTGENRIIVREGLLRAARTARPGLRALMENAKVNPPLRAEDVAFRLAPRLNAAGRLEDARQGVKLLMTEDPAEAKAIADHLEQNNRLRQQSEQAMIREALSLMPAQVNLRRDRAIVLEGEDWNTGLIGLAAGKLCERFHHPVIVLSRQGDQAVGSCRSIPGVNIWEMLNRCGDLFLRFGGHAQAAGLTIPLENIPALRRRLNEAIRESCPDRCFLPEAEYDSELPLAEVTLETVQRLEALEPTGCGNPAPVFLCRDASVQSIRRVGQDRSHLKISLEQGGQLREGIGFGLGDAADRGLTRVDALFSPGRNEFGGRVTAQMQLQALRSAEEENPAAGESEEGFFLSCLQEMSRAASKQKDHAPGEGGLPPEMLLKEKVDQLDPGDDALRRIYLAARGFRGDGLEGLAAEAGCGREQLTMGLTALAELRLLEWAPAPFRLRMLPTHRIDPGQSPLIRYLRGLSLSPA